MEFNGLRESPRNTHESLRTDTGRSLHDGVQEGNILACSQQSFVSLDAPEYKMKKIECKIEEVKHQVCYALSVLT